MKTWVQLFFALLIISTSGWAQSQRADSLRKIISLEQQNPEFIPDTSFVNALNALGFELDESMVDSVFAIAERTYALSLDLKYIKGQLTALDHMCYALELRGEHVSAIEKLQQGIDLATEVNDKSKLALFYHSKGKLCTYLGRYPEAMDCALRSQVFAAELNDKKLQANNYNTIAMVYYHQNKMEEALANYEKCIMLAEEIGRDVTVANALTNIGHIYANWKQYDKALESYNRSMDIARKAKLNFNIGLNLSSIANLHVTRENYETALPYFEEAFQLQKVIGDQMEMATTLSGIGFCYHKLNQNKRALSYAEQALEFAKQANSVWHLRYVYQILSEIQEATGNHKTALFYHKQFKIYSDSISSKDSNEQTVRLEEQYKYEKRELHLKAANEKKIARRNTWIYIGGTVLFFLCILIFVMQRNIRQRNRVNKQLVKNQEEITRQNNELETMDVFKNRLLSVVAHDVRGPLNSLKGMFYLLDKKTLSVEEIVSLVKQLGVKVSHVSDFVDDLLLWARNQMTDVEIKVTEFDLAETIHQTLVLLRPIADAKQVTIRTEFNVPVQLNADREMIKIVIRNLVSNAIKFTRANDVIEIHSVVDGSSVKVSVRDSGVGMEESKLSQLFSSPNLSSKGTGEEVGTGLGLLLCKEYIEMNRGTIGAQSIPGKGSHFWFMLPLNTV